MRRPKRAAPSRSRQRPKQKHYEQAKQLYEQQRFHDAEPVARKATEREPKNAAAWMLRAAIAVGRAQHPDAVEHLRRCIKLEPDEPSYHGYLAKSLHELGRSDEALAACRQALELQPNYPEITILMAIIEERRRHYETALELVQPMLNAGTATSEVASIAARALAGLKRHDEALTLLAEWSDRPDEPVTTRQHLYFQRFKILDKQQRYDDAFEACQTAHAIEPTRFDARAFEKYVDDLIDFFSEQTLHRRTRSTCASQVPVIIAGMPRSGTTLVEQIIDAHPQARGAGELPDLHDMAGQMMLELGSYHPYPRCLVDLSPEQAKGFADRYLARLLRDGDAERVVDKELGLYEHVGLFWMLFPKGRVIWCRRDPLDTCFSCYTSHLHRDRHAYAANLEHLAMVYAAHERLMRHWQNVLDIPVIEMRYEELIDQPDAKIRELIEFVGLPWDERCLQFYDSGRTVMTLSYDQVSRPLYRTSIQRWRHYEQHLQPLIDALREHGVEGQTGSSV